MKTVYAIHEGNMDRLEKKIKSIQNKCAQYGCEFHFAEVGEEFREVKVDNITTVTRFVLVEAEGIAIVNGWKFIATVEHTENGNIIRKVCEVEVPERYYTSKPVCEHCNSKRSRKDTYLVMNEETGEFKQVGKSCLKDFTNGMDAGWVAQYIALFDEIISGETPHEGYDTKYYPVSDILLYVAETVKHFGYTSTQGCGRSTRKRAFDYYMVQNGGYFVPALKAELVKEMNEVQFNAFATDNKETVAKALEWLNAQPESNDYMHNLKTACSLRYTESRNLGIIASLFPTFNREVEYQAKKAEEERQRALKRESEQGSVYVGEVGNRVDVDVEKIECVTSWESQWGVTRVFKIVDVNGNVFTWKTSNWVEVDKVSKIKGTVKTHTEYKGVKQTELTRCKVA